LWLLVVLVAVVLVVAGAALGAFVPVLHLLLRLVLITQLPLVVVVAQVLLVPLDQVVQILYFLP
jgi:hypothetical protein